MNTFQSKKQKVKRKAIQIQVTRNPLVLFIHFALYPEKCKYVIGKFPNPE